MMKGNRKNDDFKKIEHLLKSFSIIIPHLRISLYHNSKMIFVKSAAKTINDSIHQVVGSPVENIHYLNLSEGSAHAGLWIPRYENRYLFKYRLMGHTKSWNAY